VGNTSVLPSLDDERRELEAAEVALARTPRLTKLLRYLVERYWEGNSDHLTEYNIATEVFGRSKTSFVSSEDAIARVEVHRLRKRLREFYENEGGKHELQIVLPPGTYVPVFLPRTEPAASVSSGIVETVAADAPTGLPLAETPGAFRAEGSIGSGPTSPEQHPPQKAHPRRRGLLYALFGALAVAVAIAFSVARLAHRSDRTPGTAASLPLPVAATAGKLPALPYVSVPFRMIAGYKGPLERDTAGNLWQADQYFRDGWPLHDPLTVVPRTNDPLLFDYGRAGDSSYDIPLRPGLYELHLYFLQTADTAQAVESEDSEDKAVFKVLLNGKTLLKDFDIVSDAMGRNIADERIFRDISPAEDGYLHLHLSTVVGTPSIRAIALLPGAAHQQLPIRIATQPIPFVDTNGVLWGADSYFIGGRHLTHTLPASAGPDTELMSAERYGHFSYSIPADTRDQYTLSLYFVESFWGTPQSGGGGVGNRIFRVLCNGNTLLDNFDIYKEVGAFHLLKKTFYHLRPTAQGKLNLTFEPISNYATVSAIEVVDESR